MVISLRYSVDDIALLLVSSLCSSSLGSRGIGDNEHDKYSIEPISNSVKIKSNEKPSDLVQQLALDLSKRLINQSSLCSSSLGSRGIGDNEPNTSLILYLVNDFEK